MPLDVSNILLTGRPGCGKTTLIRRIVEKLSIPARGFYTEEVRGTGGRRTGFDVVMLDGRRGPLARLAMAGPRVGRYGVSLTFLEEAAIPVMTAGGTSLTVIDEIGKMECFSRSFREAVRRVLDSETPVIGTVAIGGTAFIREVRSRPDIVLLEVTEKTRDKLPDEIIHRLRIED
jgi:nucleoside-triphosphatase THEP1